MKRQLFISLAFITLIIPAIISSACSHKKRVVLKEDKIERRLRVVSNPLADELLNPVPRDIKVNHKTNLQIDSLNTKLVKLNCRLKNNWFKGQNRPYRKILAGLQRQGYDITNYTDKCSDRKELSIQLDNEWNMAEVNKIKNIFMRTLPFEPQICKSHLPDGKEVTSMMWTGSKYNACVSQSGFDELIHLSFETK
jgi:hypothetical protein